MKLEDDLLFKMFLQKLFFFIVERQYDQIGRFIAALGYFLKVVVSTTF